MNWMLRNGRCRHLLARRLVRLLVLGYLFGLSLILFGEIALLDHDSSSEYIAGIVRMFVVWSVTYPALFLGVTPIVVKIMQKAGLMDLQRNTAMGYDKEILIERDRGGVSDVVVEILKELRPKRIEQHGEELVAVTKVNMKTLGEIVRVDLSRAKEGHVRIMSHPRCELAVYDYGRNRDNVEKVARGIIEAFR